MHNLENSDHLAAVLDKTSAMMRLNVSLIKKRFKTSNKPDLLDPAV
ncbi:hypothetical protein NBRC111894_3500 [Sporolactobacillus inulinus]|uniref:Uncharacterized protein n=1 Tax=Sporolactobacillus inulinus TaxID=2078 RepID=A0A4Y1ZFK5_9BACL|nr:hypothetical protein NBRC111894_3500 [Sporolactobacillus inulinus]